MHRLPEMINSVRGNRSPVVDISFPEIEKFDRLPEPRAEGPRIQSGDCLGKPRYLERLIEVYSLFYYLDMADGFDAKKSKIGEKALVAANPVGVGEGK